MRVGRKEKQGVVGRQVQLRAMEELLQLVGTGGYLERLHQLQRRLPCHAPGGAGSRDADGLHGGQLPVTAAQQRLPCWDGLLVGVCPLCQLLPLCRKAVLGKPSSKVGAPQGEQAQEQTQRRDAHGHIAHGLLPAAVVDQQICVRPEVAAEVRGDADSRTSFGADGVQRVQRVGAVPALGDDHRQFVRRQAALIGAEGEWLCDQHLAVQPFSEIGADAQGCVIGRATGHQTKDADGTGGKGRRQRLLPLSRQLPLENGGRQVYIVPHGALFHQAPSLTLSGRRPC